MLHSIDSIKKMKSDILKSACVDYHALRESDKRAEAESLKPGERMGFANYNGFYSLNNRDKASEVLGSYNVKMNELLKEVQDEIKAKASEPPTTEQANLLSVLSVGAPSKDELQMVLDANGGNYAIFNALNRLADANGYHLEGENPIKSLVDTSNSLQSACKLLNVYDAENNLTPGFLQFADMMSE